MRPQTTVRPPIIAGARRRHLSELLRTWRRQPRQRSRLLFALLLTFALMSDVAVVFFFTHLLASRQPVAPPPSERRIHVPFAADADLWEPLRHGAIRGRERTQLFESFCRAAVRDITGEERFEDRDPPAVVVSWMLDADTDALGWDSYPFVRCEDAELRAVLYGAENNPSRMRRREQLHGRYVEPEAVRSSQHFRDLLQQTRDKRSPLSPLEREALALHKRLTRWQRIRGGTVEGGGSALWTASAELRQAYQTGDKNLFAAALTDFLDASRQSLRLEEDAVASRRLAAEAWLNDRAPAHKAKEWSFLAAACLAAAALVKTWRPVWHRVLFRGGAFAALGCLAWSISALVAHSIRENALLADAEQGMVFFAAALLGLGLLLAPIHREAILVLCAVSVSSIGFLLTTRGPTWPQGIENDTRLQLQVSMLLFGCAALTLAWSLAIVAGCRVFFAAPNGERLRRLAMLCVFPLRFAVVLLAGSALMDGLRAMTLGHAWHGWNVQAMATLLVLPACSVLLYARGRGWMQPFGLVMGIGLAFPLLALLGHIASHTDTWRHFQPADAWLYGVGLVNLSLIAHAALRYYFSRQRVFDA